jgi:hypothetical protein
VSFGARHVHPSVVGFMTAAQGAALIAAANQMEAAAGCI